MSAHHAPRKVAMTARVLGYLIAYAGMFLALGWFLSTLAVGGADLQSNPFEGLAWAEGDLMLFSAPFGQSLLGISLLVLGGVMAKTSPRFRRSEHGVPLMFRRWTPQGREYFARMKELRWRSYPQRRIGRRMIGLGLASALMAGGLLWLYPASLDDLADRTATLTIAGEVSRALSIAALAAALVAVIVGVFFFAAAPAKRVSEAAALEEDRLAHPAAPLPEPPQPPGVPQGATAPARSRG